MSRALLQPMASETESSTVGSTDVSRELLVANPPVRADANSGTWVMRCDATTTAGLRCLTTSAPQGSYPLLTPYVNAGWFIAAVYGDVCSKCLGEGIKATATPHSIMTTPALLGLV